MKVPQSITHEKVLRDCPDEVAAFLSAARLLGDKLLCCCHQFGYFNRGKFASLNAFLDRLEPFLAAWPAEVPLAVEVRNSATRAQHRAGTTTQIAANPWGQGTHRCPLSGLPTTASSRGIDSP